MRWRFQVNSLELSPRSVSRPVVLNAMFQTHLNWIFSAHQLRFAVHEMELLQWISVNAANDLESRMQNEIAVIELDQPQQNWIRRV